jgi:hypothetical protein
MPLDWREGHKMVTHTTGTTTFDPSLGDFVLNAFLLCGVKPTEVDATHMQVARFQTNLLNADWTASGVNMWAVDLITIPLIEGETTYTLPADTVFLLDVYLSTIGFPQMDRLMYGISRDDYASYANKVTEGTPTLYWFNKIIPPTVTFWQPPSASDKWVVNIYRATQLQDAALNNGEGPEVPFRFYDAFVWELAARLAVIYAPERAVALTQRASIALEHAFSSDTGDTGIRVLPQTAGYWR